MNHPQPTGNPISGKFILFVIVAIVIFMVSRSGMMGGGPAGQGGPRDPAGEADRGSTRPGQSAERPRRDRNSGSVFGGDERSASTTDTARGSNANSRDKTTQRGDWSAGEVSPKRPAQSTGQDGASLQLSNSNDSSVIDGPTPGEKNKTTRRGDFEAGEVD